MRWIVLPLAATALAGCASSAPMRFYTLSEVVPQDTAAPTDGSGADVRVTRVRIPGEVDRSELVQRIDANRVLIAEQDRWAAPLDEMIRRVVTTNLQSRGGGGSAGGTLSLDISEFIGDSTCAVTLRTSWEIKGTDSSATNVRGGQEIIRVPPAGACSIGALPGQMSAALGALSDKIVAATARR